MAKKTRKNCGNKLFSLKYFLYILLITVIGIFSIVFCCLYLDAFSEGVFYQYKTVFLAVSVGIITVITAFSIVFKKTSYNFVYKLFFLANILIFVAVLFLFLLKISGFLDKIDSVESFRNYISNFNGFAVFLFILISFLQVVVIPIPAFISVGAGVLLFGPFLGALYSCIGIITGSVTAFFIGRVFGFKVAKWLVGEKELNKGLNVIKGKDKIILTLMFLFPFFPDDLMCFVAGITTVSPIFFIVMVVLTRVISIFVSSYSLNNSLIPFNTWWGILIWIIIAFLVVFITILIYKKGDKIEKYFNKIISRKKLDKNK